MRISFQAFLIFPMLLASITCLMAEPWKLDINTNLTTTLNTYTDSWIGGEAGSFTWGSQFLGIAEKMASKTLNTKTTLKLQFGQTSTQDKTTKSWSSLEKSSDLIDCEELLRLMYGTLVNPFASVRIISGFVDGRDTLLTRYFNPLEITEALGASRTLHKSQNIDWSTRLGVAARQLVNRQHLDPASGNRSSDVTNDGGIEFNMDIKTSNPAKWLSYLGSLRIYEAIVSSRSDAFKGTKFKDDWRYPHVKLENTLTLSLAKYLMLNLSADMLYDKELSSHLRIKEALSIGLTYSYLKK